MQQHWQRLDVRVRREILPQDQHHGLPNCGHVVPRSLDEAWDENGGLAVRAIAPFDLRVDVTTKSLEVSSQG